MYAIGVWLWRNPKWALALAAVLSLGLWYFQDNISDWFDARKIARLEKENAALLDRVNKLEEASARQEAAITAATDARNRNDERIPAVRAASAGRVDRAATADAAVGLQDDADALGAYSAAAGSVRGKVAR
jgi:hypothetical protein